MEHHFEMLLILTNSYDATTDLLVPRLPQNRVFRLNCDILDQYQISFSSTGFGLKDPVGRTISSDDVTKCYFRKPWTCADKATLVESGSQFRDEELRYLIRELINVLWAQQKIVLVEPYAERRCGKLLQLMVAKEYFAVPQWVLSFGRQPELTGTLIVKSLSGEPVGSNTILYTTRLDENAQLDRAHPWFVQEYVAATHDITVVYCRGKLFTFSLERSFLSQSPDWREFISDDQIWSSHRLPEGLIEDVHGYMQHLGLEFGRLDFLLNENGTYVFCEVNPNGQYAWLDLDGTRGLLDCIVSVISPDTPAHSIPRNAPFLPIKKSFTASGKEIARAL